jgi:tetratricopeptide (TPR) repeat protein
MKLSDVQRSAMLDQARALVREKKQLHAVQLYLRLISMEPGVISPYTELASLYAEIGEFDAGAEILRKAERKFPGTTEIVFQLARNYVRAGRFDPALTCLKKFEGRKMPEVHYNLGLIYYFKKDYKRAEEQFRATFKINPDHPNIHESLGELLLKKGTYTEAAEWFRKGVKIKPDDPLNHYLLGVTYMKLDNWEKAQEELHVAVDLDPTQAVHWEMRGKCLFHLRKYDDAERHLLQALTLSSQASDTLIYLGRISIIKGEKEHALRYYQQVLSIDPINIKARALIAQLDRGNTNDYKRSKK